MGVSPVRPSGKNACGAEIRSFRWVCQPGERASKGTPSHPWGRQPAGQRGTPCAQAQKQASSAAARAVSRGFATGPVTKPLPSRSELNICQTVKLDNELHM
jgi:hypothetical protein